MPYQHSSNSLEIFRARYLDEEAKTPDDLFRRVSGGNKEHYELMSEGLFLPNSPTLFNAGKKIGGTLSACFVFDIEDCLLGDWPDGGLDSPFPSSILGTTFKAACVAKAGGGVGYYLGNIREEGAVVKSTHKRACGPVGVLKWLHGIRGLITQGGMRDLAQMAVLPVWHKDIRKFIHCKDMDPKALESFNLSVSWRNEDIDAIDWDSVRNAERDSHFDTPSGLWLEQCQSAWRTGCPGMLFWDIINRWNATPHLGDINATNPCQPGFATVLTQSGIATFDDVSVGDKIWTGSRFSKITNKVCTGKKLVSRYVTTAGTFVGTENHQVFENGERIEVQHATGIDQCRGVVTGGYSDNDQFTVDGWVLGDGTVHKASNNLVYLCMGQDDADNYDNVLGRAFPAKHRPGIRSHAYEVPTTITAEELPRTYERRVPHRFKTAKPDDVCSFLRGLFSANGSVAGGRIQLRQTSIDMIRDVQEMMSSVGIASYYTTDKPKVVQFENGEYECRESYTLNVTTNRKLFMEMIGFVHAYKQEAGLNVAQIPSRNWQKRTYDIIDQECLGVHQVYDITVESDEHCYWTGGLLVSNCGETPNITDEPCNLGSSSLRRFMKKVGNKFVFMWDVFKQRVRQMIRFLDDILDWNVFPHPDITKAALATRKLGLGVMGYADVLALQHIPYASQEAVDFGGEVMKTLNEEALKESVNLAGQKGAYLAYDKDKSPKWAPWCRNSTRSSIAPTGTIAVLNDDSSSIEPHYALEWDRTTNEGIKLRERIHVADNLHGFVPQIANEIPLEWHVRHQAAFQEHTDLGVSKTINLPNSATVQDISNAYKLMWELGCKGGTVYRDGCRNEQVLVAAKKSVYATTGSVGSIKTANGRKKLPKERPGSTIKFEIGGTEGYLTPNTYPDGTLGEIFIELSNDGSTLAGTMKAFARTFSLSLQRETPLDELVKLHKNCNFEPRGFTGDPEIPNCTSIVDYVVRKLEKKFVKKQVKETVETVTIGVDSNLRLGIDIPMPELLMVSGKLISGKTGTFCPDCSSELIREASCMRCVKPGCGFSRC